MRTYQYHSWGLFWESGSVFDRSNPGRSMGDETPNEQWHDGGDVTLLKAIDDGTIPKPSCITWQDWQKRRRNPFGGRRATKIGGSTRPTTTQEESKLWQATMPLRRRLACRPARRRRRRSGAGREGRRSSGGTVHPTGPSSGTGTSGTVHPTSRTTSICT